MSTILEKLDALRRAELLADVRTETLARVAAVASEERRAAGEVIYREGEVADRFYLLADGEAAATNAGREERRGPGCLLGILEVLAEGAYLETARTTRPCRLLRVEQQDFFDLMAADFHLTRGLLRSLIHIITGTRTGRA